MDKAQAKLLAQQLLDSEFDNANHDPLDYCNSMSWDKDNKDTKKAVKKKGSLAPNSSDFEKLATIIEKCGTDDVMEITDKNAVQDFLCNCVASHMKS